MSPNEIFEALLKKRGVTDREKFLDPRYESHLHDPLLLPDMKPALARLAKAQKNGEKVAIHGDYDIDGLTASTILKEAFTAFGIDCFVLIPDRFKDGYGLSERGIKAIHEQGAKLIVTVDCGSRSLNEVALATKLKMDVIVTDHHSVGDELPDCVAVINPKRADSKYPFADLAGCGVAFKLVQALQAKLDGLPVGQEKWLLDLVALGTVCDVVSLTDENRVLVKWGLQVMRRTRRPGIKALAAVSETKLSEIDTQVLGFRFGPRLNASGRLETAQASLDLLNSTTNNEALTIAQELDRLNYQRRQDQAMIIAEALEQAQLFADDPVLVVASHRWSHGIVGIAAAKLVEQLGKPVFVMQEIGETTKGSARSFGDFHLSKALDAVRPILKTGGGHALAAGCSIASEDLDKFRQSLNDYHRSLKLGDQSEHQKLAADLELNDLAGLTGELLELLDQLEPFGHGNQPPLFKVRNVTVEQFRGVGAGGKHAKVTLSDVSGNRGEGIGFGLADQIGALDGPCCFDLFIERNTFNGRTSLQYRLHSIE